MSTRAVDRSATGIRRGTVGVVATVVVLHVLGWGVLVLLVVPAGSALSGDGGAAVTLGVGLTAYALGVRHAFDADHIAAIDNTTRRLAQRGRHSSTVGFWFSLGHSSIVVLLCVVLVLGVSTLGRQLEDDTSALHVWTGVIGPVVSSVFLLLIAAINVATLRHHGGHGPRGPVMRVLGPLEQAVDRPSRMYLVGLLFGLGFDTATEVGLLALAGSATLTAVPWWAVMSLPILFAAGMSAFDTAQGAIVRRAYAWDPGRRRVARGYAVAMAAISVVAAVLIAAVQLAGVASTTFGVDGPLESVASLGLDGVGFVLTGLLLAVWIAVLAMTRRRSRLDADVKT